ncbi:MAG: Amino-acid acetyltransferase [Phycisphaerae bacterium]|nr:Amino-acid acetyltransferase [Phycisphaerae bacterium]
MIRNAVIADVPAINALITGYAEHGLMLFRSLADLYEKIRQFVVYEQDGEVLGCCALEIVWRDLAEVKSLAVRDDARGRGIGRVLVEAAETEGRRLGLDRLFALTREEQFFYRLGYQIVPKEILPHKVWSDCVKCPRLKNCDEIAVCKALTGTGQQQIDEAVARASDPRRGPDQPVRYDVAHG